MKKKQIIMLLLIGAISTGIISLYTTFAYNEEASQLENSTANYNLIYSIKEISNTNISVNANEAKYVDIILQNPYKATVKYGMYYQLLKPNEMPQNVKISLSEDSQDDLESTIKEHETKIVSIKINNNSDYNIDLTIGALIGFEQGNIEDLIKERQILIK